MIKYRNRLNSAEVRDQFGEIYDNLNFKRSKSTMVLLEPAICQFRILILTCVLINLEGYPYFQIFTINMTTTFMIIYIQWYEVYKEKDQMFF